MTSVASSSARFESFTATAATTANSVGSAFKKAAYWCGRTLVAVAGTVQEWAAKAFLWVKAFFIQAAAFTAHYGKAGFVLAKEYTRELGLVAGSAMICALAYLGYQSCTSNKDAKGMETRVAK